MPSKAHRDSAWLVLAMVPALLVLAAWVFGWPTGLAAALAGAGGLSAAGVIWALIIRPRRGGEAELLPELGALAGALKADIPPSTSAGPLDLALVLSALRSAAEGRVGELERQLGNLGEMLREGPWPLLVTDATGTVVFANRGAAEFFQRSHGLTGRSIEDLITQREVLTLHAAALSGQSGEGQVRIQRPDGQRIYQVLSAPVRLSLETAQTGSLVSLRDITELATALQLKTDFVANASHELRTPLASIKGAVDTLADGAWEDEPMRTRLLGMISGNVMRLEEMVRDLLDLSRLESAEAPLDLRSISLSELGADLAEDFAPMLRERRLSLDLRFDPRADRVRSDPKLLTLVLKNLIDNATKFAYEGSAIRVGASPTPPRADNPGELPGVRIQVADQGVGIPIAQQQRVFERFFQVDPARTGFAHRRGTGLGLAIVKHAVKVLGGTIGLESVWKQGTTMTVDIPACVEPQLGGVTGA
jgi:signal transduction histidine kinase